MQLSAMAEMEVALRDALLGLGPSDEAKNVIRPDSVADKVINGRWNDVLESSSDLLSELRRAVKEDGVDAWASALGMKRQLEVFALAVAALQVFVARNWTGFKPASPPDPNFPQDDDVDARLVLDGESVAPTAEGTALLAAAGDVLCRCRRIVYRKNWTFQWWALRAVTTHQQILTEKSETLHDEAVQIIKSVDENKEWIAFSQTQNNHSKRMRALWLLEVAHFHASYYEVAKARELTEEAGKVLGVSAVLTGALGKRTKFQHRDVPQLKVDVKEEESIPEIKEIHLGNDFPDDVKLNDEVRLERIKFSDVLGNGVRSLTLSEQCLFLAELTLRQRARPSDELTQEELSPYLQAVLDSNSCWSLKTSALLLRSQLESGQRRSVERSLMQVDTIVESIRSNPGDGFDRLALVYASRLPPAWEVEKVLCRLLQSLGSTKSALDVALRLKLWEDVIHCYHQLQLRHKAAEVIREEMQRKGESPLLLCMLGDATDDLANYEKAVELSGDRSARAFRSLGVHHYFRKDYSLAVDFLEKSVNLNSYQLDTLLRLGYAAMQVDKWELAAKTYRTYCTYEFDNFEAWNNLSNAYIKLGQKSRAWRVLQEAAKCDYDNWKIWDNIMVVSTDCAQFDEVIRAYHRVLDLKEKHCDLEVLRILRDAVCSNHKSDENDEENKEEGSFRHRDAALKLLGRLTGQITTEGELWEIYADLSSASSLGNDGVVVLKTDFKVCQRLQKASACFSQKSGWESDVDKTRQVLQVASKYANAVVDFAQEDPTQARPLLSSSRMSVRGILSKVKKHQTSLETGELVESLTEIFRKVEEDVELLGKTLEALRTS